MASPTDYTIAGYVIEQFWLLVWPLTDEPNTTDSFAYVAVMMQEIMLGYAPSDFSRHMFFELADLMDWFAANTDNGQ